MTKIKFSNEKIAIGKCETKIKHDDIATIRVNVECENACVAAFGDGIYPSIMLNSGADFTKLTFVEFMGFKVWSAGIDDDVLDICLVKKEEEKATDRQSLVFGKKAWVDQQASLNSPYDQEEWLEKEGCPTN